MGNRATLQPNVFSSENQPPPESKSRKGIPNRATVFKKFLSMKVMVKDPRELSKMLKISMHEAAALGQLVAAAEGSTVAWKEIQDSIFGKIADKTEHTGADGNAIRFTLNIGEPLSPKQTDD